MLFEPSQLSCLGSSVGKSVCLASATVVSQKVAREVEGGGARPRGLHNKHNETSVNIEGCRDGSAKKWVETRKHHPAPP